MNWLAAELPPDIPYTCVAYAAQLYSVPAPLVVSVLRVEAGKVGVAYVRKSGTYLGPGQISTEWVPHFKSSGWTEALIRDNACINVYATTYILAYYKAREADWSLAIARYNVGSLDTSYRIEAGTRYVAKVHKHWTEIFNRWNVR